MRKLGLKVLQGLMFLKDWDWGQTYVGSHGGPECLQ